LADGTGVAEEGTGSLAEGVVRDYIHGFANIVSQTGFPNGDTNGTYPIQTRNGDNDTTSLLPALHLMLLATILESRMFAK
jgi:hypothetical protein